MDDSGKLESIGRSAAWESFSITATGSAGESADPRYNKIELLFTRSRSFNNFLKLIS